MALAPGHYPASKMDHFEIRMKAKVVRRLPRETLFSKFEFMVKLFFHFSDQEMYSCICCFQTHTGQSWGGGQGHEVSVNTFGQNGLTL